MGGGEGEGVSDQSIVALTAVVVTGVVSLGGLFFNLWNSHQERRERYRIAMYEKRLSVHQDAFKWMIRLFEPVQRARQLSSGNRDLPDGVEHNLMKVYDEARDWWDSNCLYLDDKARAYSLDFIEGAGTYLRQDQAYPSQSETSELHTRALRAIEEGMGKMHLLKSQRRPVPERSHD